ncbi:MAG: cytochrome c oxidase subunit II [Hyphomicrobiaceae bacterium]|nr:cytochrome c oxidase subunit II [Hyphomicrobiaceae bacterium]
MSVFKGMGLFSLVTGFSALMTGGATAAEHVTGQPYKWQLGFQEQATAVGRQMSSFHDFVLVIITLVTIFVVLLLAYVIWKFNEKANPVPSKTSHNTMIEVIWTVVPILVLLVITIPSFRLLFAQYDFPKADVVIKATGNQWYWSYEYPDADGMSFDALMLRDDDNKPIKGPDNAPRTLAVDNYVVVPVNKNVELLITASDVIHAWAIPAFTVKVDAIPGRVIKTWFNADRIGTYYGQCSELCGKDHGYMPIAVKVVSQADYEAWLVKAKKEYASAAPVRWKNAKTQLAAARVAIQK